MVEVRGWRLETACRGTQDLYSISATLGIAFSMEFRILGPLGCVNYFEDDWLTSTLALSRQRPEPILQSAALAAAAHPGFAEAVLAFSSSGFSVSEAARHLVVHPNTAMYRLKRWEELTGWDPRTFDGLVRSIAVLRTEISRLAEANSDLSLVGVSSAGWLHVTNVER